jgi:hypothetical protein
VTKQHGQKNKATDKLRGEPIAGEMHCISTPESLFTEVTASSMHINRRSQIRLLLCTIALSAAVAFIQMLIVLAGYDWGYRLVQKIWAQPDGHEQFAWAVVSLGIVILPGAFGLAYGACCSHVSGKSKHWTWIPYLNLGA